MNRITQYLREVRAELRKVAWPGRRQVIVYTSIVVGSVIFISSLMWVVDSILSQGLGLLIK